MNKYEQTRALKQGGEIVVATPGRFLEHVAEKVRAASPAAAAVC